MIERAKFWNVTAGEREATYPCDSYLTVPYEGLLQAMDVNAPAAIVFRWLCQLKIAPYSYDWLDNGGRPSPRQLTPDLEHLERGQFFMIGRIVEFEPNRHITCVTTRRFERLFGPLAITYAVQPQGDNACRLVVKLEVGATSGWGRLRRTLLIWGDLIMMRKQLLTIKELAEGQIPN